MDTPFLGFILVPIPWLYLTAHLSPAHPTPPTKKKNVQANLCCKLGARSQNKTASLVVGNCALFPLYPLLVQGSCSFCPPYVGSVLLKCKSIVGIPRFRRSGKTSFTKGVTSNWRCGGQVKVRSQRWGGGVREGEERSTRNIPYKGLEGKE